MGSFSHTTVSGCLPSSSEVAGDVSEKSPYLMSVLSVLSEPFVLAGFALTLDLTLESLLTLEPDITPALLSARIALPLPDSPSLTLLTSFLGTLRKATCVPLSVCSRLTSLPTHTRSGTTSCIRRQSQRADLGQALSLTIETPISSAILSSFLCNSVDEPSKLSLSPMNLMMA